jgi:ankyrin repeat protein
MNNQLLASWLDWKTVCVEDIRRILAKGVAINERDRTGNTPLMRAVSAAASSYVVETLLTKGMAGVGWRNKKGMTALMNACAHRASYDVVKLLVDAGSDINSRDREGWSALLYALAKGESLEVVRLLLDHGAETRFSWWNHFFMASDVARAGRSSRTVVGYVACRENDREHREGHEMRYDGDAALSSVLYAALHPVVRRWKSDSLLDGRIPWNSLSLGALREYLVGGADATAKDETGTSVLMKAVSHGADVLLIRELLANGAGIRDADVEGNTPFLLACRHHHSLSVIRLLLSRGASMNRRNHIHVSPLLAMVGNPLLWHAVPFLLSSRVRIHVKNSKGESPLHVALRSNAPRFVIEELLAHGADVRSTDRRGWTPTMTAIHGGASPSVIALLWNARFSPVKRSRTVVRYERRETLFSACDVYASRERIAALAEGGADIRAVDHMGMTALHHACASTIAPEVIAYLLERGAPVNAKDSSGLTPLLTALVFRRDIRVVRILVENGADVSARDEAGLTPLGMACLSDSPMTIKAYLSHTAASVIPAMYDEGRDWRHFPFPAFLRLVSRGACLTAKGRDGMTALHLAVCGGCDAKKVETLIRGGADVNCRDYRGRTPLFLAAMSFASLETAKMLLFWGADTDIPDEYGRTPLTECRVRGNREMERLLNSYGTFGNVPLRRGQKHPSPEPANTVAGSRKEIDALQSG